MSGDIGIGKLIDCERHRDAIHIAVAPIEAGEKLSPGERVGIVDGKAMAVDPAIGIVDPYLLKGVKAGQRFYLFLFPGSVTSLRHEWEHPAFEKGAPSPGPAMSDKAVSEKWLRAYASVHSPYDDAETAYENLLDGIKRGEVFYHGTDLHGFGDLDDPDELKHHAQIVLGITISWGTFTFSCSC